MPYIYSVLFYSDILIKTASLKLKKKNPENTKTQILFEKEKKWTFLQLFWKPTCCMTSVVQSLHKEHFIKGIALHIYKTKKKLSTKHNMVIFTQLEQKYLPEQTEYAPCLMRFPSKTLLWCQRKLYLYQTTVADHKSILFFVKKELCMVITLICRTSWGSCAKIRNPKCDLPLLAPETTTHPA